MKALTRIPMVTVVAAILVVAGTTAALADSGGKSGRKHPGVGPPNVSTTASTKVTSGPAGSPNQSAVAPTGSTLKTLTPAHSGNGRALAFDPFSGHLFYTIFPDTHIYAVDTMGASVATLSPGIQYGALSFDPQNRILWGGEYGYSNGKIDTIDPTTGTATHQFTYSYPAGDSCYAQPAGNTDGLGFDPVTKTLWLSDDNARHVFNVTLTGTTLSSFRVPNSKCNTGIAVAGQFLWLAFQSGPDTGPFGFMEVRTSSPGTVVQQFAYTGPGAPEGIAVDRKTFVPNCALWTNHFGAPTTLIAFALEPGCPGAG